MKKYYRILFSVILSVFLITTMVACGGKPTGGEGNKDSIPSSSASSDNSELESMTFKFASIVSTTHDLYTYGAKVFIEKVEELSGGKITIEHFPDSQLGKPADMINLANSGAADMVELGPSYIPGKLVLSNVFQLPGALPDPEIGSKVIWDVLKDENSIIRQTDFTQNGIVPLYAATLPLYQIVTVEKKPLTSFEDLQGLKLRSAGGVQDLIVEALGAVPVAMDRTEVYQSLQRGTLDGGVFNLPSLEANQTIEVLHNTTTNANVTSFVGAVAISEKVWNRLPEKVQEILKQAGEAAAQSLAENVKQSDEKALQDLLDRGYNAWTLSPEELEKLKEMVTPVWDRWVSDVDKLGFDGQAAIDEMNKALKKYQ